MDGSRESSPNGEGQAEHIEIPAPDIEKEKTPDPISTKLSQIRSNAHTAGEKISHLVGTASPDGETEATSEQTSIDALSPQIEELNQAELTPAEYLMRSKQLLGTSEQIRKRILAEHEDEQRNYYEQQIAIRNIDHQIKDLERVSGIKRFTSILERKRLAQQRTQLEKKAADLQAHVDSKKQLIDSSHKGEKSIHQKQEEVIVGLGIAEITAIKNDYEEFLGEIMDDGTIIAEIQNAYIDKVVSPIVDENMKSAKLPDEKKEAFFSTLRNCLRNNGVSEEEKSVSRDEFHKMVYEYGFYSANDACQILLQGADRDVITKLVGKIAASDISGIKTNIESRLTGYDSLYRFDRVMKNAIDSYAGSWNRNNGGFGAVILAELNQTVEDNYPNMRLWGIVKTSPAAIEIFGDLIQAEDDKIYATALEKSLTDTEGTHIGVLSRYTSPEAIRNLIILAAADQQNYRTIHANGALRSFAERSDWKDILDKVEQSYPALASARPVLEKWSYTDHGNNPLVQEATADFALSIIEDNHSSGRLKWLANEALPNHSIVTVLHKRGVISEAESQTLSEAGVFIEGIEEKPWENKDIPHISSYWLKDAVRKNLFNLMYLTNDGDKKDLESMRRLITLSQKILENKTNYLSLSFLASNEVVEVIAKKQIQPELIFAIPDQAKLLMDEKMRETRAFIFEHGETLLKSTTDLRFLSNLVGEFGQKSDPLIRGYHACLEAGVMTSGDKELVLEFARQFRVISPTTLSGYKEAKDAGHEKVYIAQLTALAEKMTGSGSFTDEERLKPYFKDLLKHVYSNNSGQWTSFESNESCNDRKDDTAKFKIRSRYEIDLLSQSEIRIKDGELPNPRVQEEVQAPILAISERMSQMGYDYEEIKKELNTAIDQSMQQVIDNGGLFGLNPNLVTSPEEKLFLVLTDSIYGTKTLNNVAVKNLLIRYEFANFEDITDYIAGTRDRVGRAGNQDYALLCESGAFYSDRIKEINRRLVEASWNNPAIAELMPEYFKKLAHETVTSGRQDKINKLQVDKLGLSESFVKQVGKILEKRKGRKYEPDEVREIIRRYEGFTDGLSEKASTSKNPQTKAFYGQLRSQREKTFDALNVITGETTDPSKVHLGEANLQQILDVEANIREGKYDNDQFASYTVQRFIDLFDEERTKIEGELNKFESLSGKQREVLYANITKTKESAHARMVGGVCVSGDNPSKHPDQNIWNMPNYFQLVFQEPDTLQCQGLVLLHHFTEGDKKVLTASVNPSSTYLYSVDELALFTGIMGTLEQFASDNGFDLITLSQNKGIRTNRTGGQFEKAMDERVAQVNRTFRFNTPQQFSYHPNYQLQDMDVVWENKEKV